MCGAPFLERCEAGDGIDIVLVEDVNAMKTKDVLAVRRRCGGGHCRGNKDA